MDALQERLGRPEIEFYPRRELPEPDGLPGGGPPPPLSPTHPDHARPTTIPASPPSTTCPGDRGRAPPRAHGGGVRLVRDHPVNLDRLARGKPPANAIWLWGQGNAPSLPKFRVVHGLKGAILSAVNLVRGVGILAGWDRIDVPGATGYLDTDYAAKGRDGVAAWRTTTSSASTSRPPTRPATKAGPTPRSRPSSGSTGRSSARSAGRSTPTAAGSSSRPTTPPSSGPRPTTGPGSPGPWRAPASPDRVAPTTRPPPSKPAAPPSNEDSS